MTMKSIKIPFVALLSLFSAKVFSQSPVTPPVDFYSLTSKTITGDVFKFDKLKGKMVLIVNTASKCGYTPQFADLEELNSLYKGKIVILGFPSNDFGAQDPGSNLDIKEFCEANYGVTFTMMEKTSVKGDSKNNIYKWLTDKSKNGWNTTEPSWNFGKYLIDEKGRLVAFYPSRVKPTDNEIVSKIKKD